MDSRRVPGPRLRLRDKALALGAALLLAPASAAAESCQTLDAFQSVLEEDVLSIPGGSAPALPETLRS